ncbi:RluA family pseudouridine synthase [Plebeiibacterium marinum]|uniref:RluA family pseudouridine synthase n=1 Tax=Plebeiibacterium marinum TaxID=2992111 RepID=A0AAE3MEX1_9BACT|nr:RluA family pseudouridine synthase [Plebeiobacterium marinum]MCW3806563.1 RluA family pseudouridine synthase [Plebeiobacterium marinum]
MQLILQEKGIVPISDNPQRLSDVAPEIFKSLPSKKSVKKAVKNGLVYVNGKKGHTADYMSGGELLELYQDCSVKNKPVIDIPIDVIYEDEFLAVVSKPAGLVVSGNKKRTLENALPANLKKSKQEGALDYPEPIHRLDYPTSGALLVGKTRKAVIELNKIFENREITKKYMAVAVGEMNTAGIVEKDVDQKYAKSAFKVLHTVVSDKFKKLNLVELTLFTGRRHQLRQHMASLGNPILGDELYGIEGLILKGKGLYLHSFLLEFYHPFLDKPMKLTVQIPNKFMRIFPDSLEK